MTPILVYSAPKWREELQHFPDGPRPGPAILERDTVAYVDLQPIGYRLIETAGGWRLAWQLPRQSLGKQREFITRAGTYLQAADALARALALNARPVYPDLPLAVDR